MGAVNAPTVPGLRRLALAVVVLAAVASLTTACGDAAPRWVAAPSAPSVPSPVPPSSGVPTPGAWVPPAARSPAVPPGVTAAVAVFDRQTGTFTEQRNVTMRFRSASLVKLLIALDYLWSRGPDYAIPAADRGRLDLMLRSSDDNAASYFYKLGGSGSVVTRMVTRLALKDTVPPPPERSGWGSTAISAADLVRVYRYVLDTAPAPVRDYVMGSLRQSTRCGTDGFDQSFGIPSAFGRPSGVKGGWYELGGKPVNRCVENTASTSGPVIAPAANNVDWAGEVLHTTGTVGTGDRAIVVVLTVHRHGTAFATATAVLTRLTGSLRVPGRG